MKRILVATDGSAGGNRAVDAAAELAKATGAMLSIVTVAGGLGGDELRHMARAEGGVGDAIEGLCTQTLHDAAARAARHGVPTPHTETGWGDPAEAILKFAAAEKADTIVLGRRGRGRLTGLLLGSVSQKIASHAPCTVIIVP